ncbi:MAG: T9SS type A sorting domain-containing protein [Flavobacteriales bacterium]
MKKKITIILLLGLFVSNINVFGHGETQTKAKCSWGWKYKAKSRVNNGPGITAQTVQSCGCYNLTASVSNPCAYQNSTNNCGWSSFSGAVFATPALCGRGYPNSPMFYELMSFMAPPPADTAEKVNVSNSSITFLKHKIKINNVVGFIEAKDDMRAFYEVKIWLPAHDLVNMVEDTLIDDNEVILWQGKVSIIDDQLVLEGGFYNETFNVVQIGNKKRVNFNGKNFNIHLPHSVNVDDVVVVITADGGFNQEKTFRIASDNTDASISKGEIKFDVYPNPSDGNFTINFKSNIDCVVNVKIYSLDGRYIADLHNTTTKKEDEISVKFDTKSLGVGTGMYFIYINNEKDVYIKKVIVQ